MTDETMVTQDGIRVGLVGFETWAAAMEQIRDDTLPHADEDTLAGWEAAGIVTPRGLAADWGLALRVAQRARAGMELVSVFQGVAFDAMVFVLGDDMVTVTSRAAVAPAENGWQATGVDPMLEVALAPSSDPWLLLRRALPPLDLARAQPRLPRGDEAVPLMLKLEEVPTAWEYERNLFAQRLLQLPTLPADVRDALEPEASVFAYAVGEPSTGPSASSDAWAVGRNLYYMVPGRTGITQVPPGQLGAQLVSRLAAAAGGR
ncbi:hypothetical protein [Tessaracoccus sp. ZS01]|uniref:hypothetical protein n=1 Tax=Tessaracoccus sp. ZS01 TaxID=1906324 RepID=UPI00096C8199|nr:hypothetical protein [Tessaracoccus sp. ZS01]MCG6567015.1 hypothetical protein [Tessaracoccus sp. ZS01]OMG57425.1 hypothetical protein BJN44_05160 [Tessaracoccus sp. ZS01]